MPDLIDPGRALAELRPTMDRALERALNLVQEAPPQMLAAARYPIDAGGKRLRPALVHWFAASFLGDAEDLAERTWAPSAAIELIHTYSLVHDDLPCMDDDDLRRGKPTTHVVHGEALGVLVGDGLQALAFEVLASQDRPCAGTMVSVLARAAGMVGMVGGQALDLAAEGKDVDEAAVSAIHQAKTGALLGAAAELGAIAAGADPDQRARCRAYGLNLGLLFQYADDLLDVTASQSDLGKTPGKDQAAGKATIVALLGVAGARARVADLVAQLEGEKGILGALPGWIARRSG